MFDTRFLNNNKTAVNSRVLTWKQSFSLMTNPTVRETGGQLVLQLVFVREYSKQNV